MVSKRTVTFRINANMDDQLGELAAATDQTKSWHIEQAAKNYLDLQAWQSDEIRKGLADMAASRVTSYNEVGK